ncbi:MAG TPA: amidase [Burkholderiaceae bacterium]|nr:amidase [Burkholderiaceae bacterium]
MTDPTALEAAGLARAIRRREISCREVMLAYLARIDRLNPRVNAVVTRQDGDRLVAQADERDAQLGRGPPLGWMHGFPIAIKDLAATAGIRTTLGSPLLRNVVPVEDSIMVARLKAAGAIVIGKTNTPEFGLGSQTYNGVFGTTTNAYDATRTSGGSSGGAAVAVALRMIPVADGSDMMGSLRNPAAYNNVLGFRPSFGRIPAGPPAPEVFLQQLSSDGPMARTVSDLALLFATQAGADARAPLSIREDPATLAAPLQRDLAGTRVAWLGDLGGYLPFEPGILELCRAAVTSLTGIGCIVEDFVPDFDYASLWTAWCRLRHWLVAGRLNDLYRVQANRASIKPEALWEIERGVALSALDVYEASRVRSAWYQTLRTAFETYEYLVLPSAQVFPFDAGTHWPRHVAGREMDTYHRWMEVVVPASMAGGPVISVPVGFNADGLPMGMQIIGRRYADLAVLQLAYAYEQATQWVAKRPPPQA